MFVILLYIIAESTSRIGFIASIGSMIVIIFVLCGYIVVCAATKFLTSTWPNYHAQICASFPLHINYRFIINYR